MEPLEGGKWREEAIARRHDRAGFDCGDVALNDYLRRYARQNHQSGGSKTYVVVDMAGPKNILGYYSVSPGAVAHDRVPEELVRALGRYDVSGYRLARLAVDVSMQGKGLGKRLLMRAGARAISAAKSVGGVALLIDAKGENVARWYERFGAVPLRDDSLTLFLHLRALEASIEAVASGLEQS